MIKVSWPHDRPHDWVYDRPNDGPQAELQYTSWWDGSGMKLETGGMDPTLSFEYKKWFSILFLKTSLNKNFRWFWTFHFGTEVMMCQKIARVGWSGIGMATGGIHPTGFEFHPTPIPTGGVLLFCRSLQHTRIVIELSLLGVPRLTFGERGTWLGEWPLLVAEMQKA